MQYMPARFVSNIHRPPKERNRPATLTAARPIPGIAPGEGLRVDVYRYNQTASTVYTMSIDGTIIQRTTIDDSLSDALTEALLSPMYDIIVDNKLQRSPPQGIANRGPNVTYRPQQHHSHMGADAIPLDDVPEPDPETTPAWDIEQPDVGDWPCSTFYTL